MVGCEGYFPPIQCQESPFTTSCGDVPIRNLVSTFRDSDLDKALGA